MQLMAATAFPARQSIPSWPVFADNASGRVVAFGHRSAINLLQRPPDVALGALGAIDVLRRAKSALTCLARGVRRRSRRFAKRADFGPRNAIARTRRRSPASRRIDCRVSPARGRSITALSPLAVLPRRVSRVSSLPSSLAIYSRSGANACSCSVCGAEMNEAGLRMTRIPKGAELVLNKVSGAPGFWIGNVIAMAGVPSIMQAMLDEVAPNTKSH